MMIQTENLASALPVHHLPTGIKILIVDDVMDIQIVLKYFLELQGAVVFTADCGAAAIEIGLKEVPDLILMDMQLPDMSGCIATQRLRSEGFTNPIVAMTGFSDAAEREMSLQAGCSDYLVKPIDWDVLLDAIDRQLSERAKTATPRLFC